MSKKKKAQGRISTEQMHECPRHRKQPLPTHVPRFREKHNVIITNRCPWK